MCEASNDEYFLYSSLEAFFQQRPMRGKTHGGAKDAGARSGQVLLEFELKLNDFGPPAGRS